MNYTQEVTLFLILSYSFLFLSVDYQSPPKQNCTHSSYLDETYYIKKKETLIVQAIRHHGFELKRGLEDTYGNSKDIHHWRIMNINTPNGHIEELFFKIEKTTQGNSSLTVLKICFSEKIPDGDLETKLKLHRRYIKKHIINKIKQFNI